MFEENVTVINLIETIFLHHLIGFPCKLAIIDLGFCILFKCIAYFFLIAVRSVTPAFKFLSGSQIGENKRRLCCCVADPEISIFAILGIRKNAKAERVRNILFAEILIHNELLFVRMVIDGNKSEIFFFVFSRSSSLPMS